MMQGLISQLVCSADSLDKDTSGFLVNQLLDTMAFFLAAGNEMRDQTEPLLTRPSRSLS